MGRNILNNDCDTNVYLNRDPIESTLPVQAIQSSPNNPILISLKGLNGFTANKFIKVNSAGTALEYGDDNTESITVSLPLLRTGDVLSLKGLILCLIISIKFWSSTLVNNVNISLSFSTPNK